MKAQVGQSAPDFALYDTEKNKIILSEQRGSNVVLLFFPAAFTGVCTAELCSVRDNLKNYEKVNAKVYGISVDALFTLNKFKLEQNLNFSLLSDFNKEASKSYGSLYDNWIYDMQGVSKRSAFVIDKEGVIRYAEVLENAGEQPNFEAIDHILQTLS